MKGIEILWNTEEGTCSFQGLPVAMMWVDTTLAGLMSGVATMVGPERFSLALQSEGRKSVEADWALISRHAEFRDGFRDIGVVASVAGWGDWQMTDEDLERSECRFRAHRTWEGLYQRKLGVCWGSAMLAGKLAGYCTKRFGANCWATQTSFIAKGDPYDEFVVAPSVRVVEDEVERLLSSDLATRADLAVSLTRLREAQAQLLVNQDSLELEVRNRTAELAASRDQLQAINDRLQSEVDEHRHTEEARQHSQRSLQVLLELVPFPMAIVSLDGNIEHINKKSVQEFGFSHAEIPTMDKWWILAYPDPAHRSESAKRWTRHVEKAVSEGGDIARDNYRITCKDGSTKTVKAFGALVSNKVLVVFDDVTSQALQEDTLRRSHADLELRVQQRTADLADRNRQLQAEVGDRERVELRLVQANAALEHTMAQLRKLGLKLARVEEQERKRMAHILHDQLQQSLVAAQFSLSSLEHGISDTTMQGALRTARNAVEDALKESKSLVLDLSPPILRESGIAPAIAWLGLRMEEKHGLTVKVEVADRSVILKEDLRLAIFHAVRELLFNVVKHSGVKAARVSFSILNDTMVQVAVADEGTGFDALADAQNDDSDGGFGLLAIRERFEALGGAMEIESRLGHGFRVSLTAPLTPLAATASLHSNLENPNPRLDDAEMDPRIAVPTTEPIRVLLADDHYMVREGLVRLLSYDSGIEVVGEAADGETALAKTRTLRPDVVLMDIGMPNMDGIEATRIVHAEFPEMVVIGLSMHAESDRGDAMRKAGASAYVSKSEASEVLVATIHACCRR